MKPSQECTSIRKGCRPFTGAWIETITPDIVGTALGKVAPSRGRGLKHAIKPRLLQLQMSPLHGGVD